MSFYRHLLAAVAAVAIASPVFADDTTTTTTPADNNTVTTTTTTQTSNESSAIETKININKASTKELMKVKGLNAPKARAIVAYRKKHGDFKAVNEIAKVKGFTKMKSATLQDIENQITVE